MSGIDEQPKEKAVSITQIAREQLRLYEKMFTWQGYPIARTYICRVEKEEK